jgi:hypothetical protein
MNNDVSVVDRGLNKIFKSLFVSFEKSNSDLRLTKNIESICNLIGVDSNSGDSIITKRLPEFVYTSLVDSKNQMSLNNDNSVSISNICKIEDPRFVILNKDFDTYYNSSKSLFLNEFKDYGNENVYGLMYTHSELNYKNNHNNIKDALDNLSESFNKNDSIEKIEFIKKSLARIIPEIMSNQNPTNHVVSGYFSLLLTEDFVKDEDLINSLNEQKRTIILKRPIVAHLKITEAKNHNYDSGISWLNDKGAYTYESLTFVLNSISLDSIILTRTGYVLRYYFVETIPTEFKSTENKRFMDVPYFNKASKNTPEYQQNLDYLFHLMSPDFDDNTVIRNYIINRVPKVILDLLDNHTFIAGGFLRDLYSALIDLKPLKEANFKDIDIFCTYDSVHFNQVIIPRLKLHFDLECISLSKNDSSIYRFIDKNKIVYDLVNFPNNIDVNTFIETFDFTINMIGYNGKNIVFPYGKRDTVIGSIKTKKLICSANHIYFAKPVRSVERLARLQSKGYSISQDEVDLYIKTILDNRRV